jgi:hypothetical protein
MQLQSEQEDRERNKTQIKAICIISYYIINSNSHVDDDNDVNNNSIQFFIIYVLSQQL